ncbi:serine hydrolase domain-containing protein [Soonwooa sp.]|uniref:serine hydrolase domain-containing protein n=1 Tax=Soonwooa sp. TaxID=1938592 RepID=UPI0026064B10|nr:serine hydrolase domain-containing protein [Soonwooa sp.]
MKLALKILFSFVLSIVSYSVSAQSKQVKQIDSLMQNAFNKGFFNGNVLVAKNNKIIYNSAFGFTDVTKSKKLNTDDRFHIGSITKEFSAVALMQLQEKGKLNINDKISKFLQDFPAWANEVSIKNLLQYTSGLPSPNFKMIKNDQDIFDGLKNIEKLDFKAGTQYDYSNSNFFLRQFIVEKITGLNFKTYAEKFIFKPCKMETAIMTPINTENKIAKGFNKDGIADKPEPPITGGTYVTTTDLFNWEKCLQNNKIVNQKSVFVLGQHFDKEDTQSALGEAKYENGKLIQHSHDGRAGSYEALLVSDVKEKTTIILLGNNYHGKLFEITDEIKAILKKRK